jgi:hypothetical protein
MGTSPGVVVELSCALSGSALPSTSANIVAIVPAMPAFAIMIPAPVQADFVGQRQDWPPACQSSEISRSGV